MLQVWWDTWHAKYYENEGCCWVLEENNFNSTTLYKFIKEIINDRKKLKNVRENMKKNDSKDVYIKAENAINEFI